MNHQQKISSVNVIKQMGMENLQNLTRLVFKNNSVSIPQRNTDTGQAIEILSGLERYEISDEDFVEILLIHFDERYSDTISSILWP